MEVATASARSSSSSSHKPAAISRESQDSTFAPCQQRNTAKVNILRPIELNEILMIARPVAPQIKHVSHFVQVQSAK